MNTREKLNRVVAATAFIAYLSGTMALTSCNNGTPNPNNNNPTGPTNPCPTNPDKECDCPQVNCTACNDLGCSLCQGSSHNCTACNDLGCSLCNPSLSNDELAELFRQFAEYCGLNHGHQHVQTVADMGFFTPGTTAFHQMVRTQVIACLGTWSQENIFNRNKNIEALGTFVQCFDSSIVSDINFPTINVSDRPGITNLQNPRSNVGIIDNDGTRRTYSLDFAQLER